MAAPRKPQHASLGRLVILLALTPGLGLDLSGDRHHMPPTSTARGCPSQVSAVRSPIGSPGVMLADFAVSVNGSYQWVVNGVVNPTLTLTRGQTYLFDLTAFTDEHPFLINSHANDPWGTVFAGPAFGQTISFTPDEMMPETVYYHCEVHYGGMAGAIILAGGPPVCVGDLNGDLTVNSVDFAVFVNAFGSPCTDCPADLNGDGSVNSFDFALFVNGFSNGCN